MSTWKNFSEILQLMGDESTPLEAGYSVSESADFVFHPTQMDSDRSNIGVTVARVFTCEKSATNVHNVVVAYDPFTARYDFWCGDKYVEGTLDKMDARRTRGLEYLAKKGVTITPKVELYAGGSHKASTACGFYNGGKRMCKHCRGVFAYLQLRAGGASAFLEAMTAAAAPLTDGPASAAPAATPGVDPMLAKLNRYAFAMNTILEGDKGWGKTWLISKYCAEAKIDDMVFIAGHEGLESVDLVGHMIRGADGGMSWKDGKLSQAFRTASCGLRVVLFIDEILRIRRRELSVLVGALAPHADGKLRLGTGRAIGVADGLAVEEVLVCDRADLWVVCTTNVGAGYEVDDMEEALSDRFPIILRIDGDAAALRTKLGGVVARRGFKPAVLERMVKLWSEHKRFRDQGELTRQMNLRHLSEIVEMAKDETEILPLALDRVPQWVERDTDGSLVEAQKSMVERLIKTTFAGAA